jgi:hypothetical protein
MSTPTLLDIETIARPEEELRKLIPPWDIEEARSRVPKSYKKEEVISGWLEDDRVNHGKDLIEKAALNAETGTVAVVGFWQDGKVEQFVHTEAGLGHAYTELPGTHFPTESELIEHAFRTLWDTPVVLGWNLLGFDLPFLIKRAWLLGVTVPKSIFSPLSRYPINERFVDTMKVWQVGNYKAPFASLNNTLRAFDLPDKGDGKDFGKLWAEDRAKALEYNAKELEGQAALYMRLGLL